MRRFILPFFLFLLFFSSHSVAAVEYGGIGGKPAHPRADNVRTESIFVHEAEPGTSVSDAVLVVNNANEEKTLVVYGVDSVNSSDGAFACAQQADASTSVGTWITLDQTEVTLASGSEQEVPFTVQVPETADVGEHNGCIVIQEKQADPNTIEDIESGMSISFRSAIRVAITVPGDIVRELSILHFNHTVGDNGRDVINVKLQNDGNVSLDTDVAVTTRSWLQQMWPEQGGEYPVLRDQQTEWHYELPISFWGGWYQSSLVVAYDAADNAAIGEVSGEALTELTSETGWFFVRPAQNAIMIYIGILAAAVILLIGMMVLMHRRRQLGNDWVKYTVKSGEDLKQLAERYTTTWKMMAKVNRISAPFVVKVGDQIKVPKHSTQLDDQPSVPKKSNKPKTQRKVKG